MAESAAGRRRGERHSIRRKTPSHNKVYPPKPDDTQTRTYRTSVPVAAANVAQAGGLLADQGRALGGARGARGDAMGGAAMGALRGLRGLGASNLPKKTEKTVAAARELTGFLQGFVEQVRD